MAKKKELKTSSGSDRESNIPEIFTDPDTLPEQIKIPRDWTEEEKCYWLSQNHSLFQIAIAPFNVYKRAFNLDTEDMLQIAAEVSLRCFMGYNPSKTYKLSTYVFRSITNYFTSEYRKITTERHGKGTRIYNFSALLAYDPVTYVRHDGNLAEDTIAKEPIHPFIQGERSTEDAIESAELVKAIYKILYREFSPEDREVFIRNVILGESQRSISREMHIPQPYVSSTRRWIQTRIMVSLFQQGLTQ